MMVCFVCFLYRRYITMSASMIEKAHRGFLRCALGYCVEMFLQVVAVELRQFAVILVLEHEAIFLCLVELCYIAHVFQ